MVMVQGGGGTSYISYVLLTVEVNISAFPPCDVAFNVAPATKSFSIAIPDILAGHEAIPVFWLHAIPVIVAHCRNKMVVVERLNLAERFQLGFDKFGSWTLTNSI
jgi:hypothetical protein